MKAAKRPSSRNSAYSWFDFPLSLSAWGRGLKSLGRKSVSASLSLGKKSISVVTLGAVTTEPQRPPEPPIPRVWAARHFYQVAS